MSSNSLRTTTALIVGGGPVGRIIGKYLKLSGVDDIGLMLKPKYAPIADQGFELHQLLTLKKKRLRQRYDDFKIIPSVETLARVHFDHIYVCVTGPELRSGWLEQAWPHLRHSLWIVFTPGVDDYEYLAQTVPERYIVLAKPGFIAYDAPLPSEDVNPPGIAYWFPPWQMTTFKAHDEETTAVLTRMFDRGGLPAGTTSTFHSDRLYDNAATTCFAAALEIHGWSFERLLADVSGLARLCVTQGEIGAAVMAKYGAESTLNRRMRKPFWWKLVLKYLDALVPFPLPEYLESHFSRHRRQMEQQFGDFVKLILAAGGQPTGTQSLARDWARQRPALAERSLDHMMPMGMVANTHSRSVFSETGELGGEARGKRAADAKGMPLGATVATDAIQGPPASGSQQFPAQRPSANPTQPVNPAQLAARAGQQGHPQQNPQQGFNQVPNRQAQPQHHQHPPQQQQQHPQHQHQHPPQQQGYPGQDYAQDHTEKPHPRDED